MASATQVLRRLELFHIVLASLWGGGMILATLVNREQGTGYVAASLLWAGSGLSLAYLVTIAASVRVTPTHVLVDNPYVRHVIPRRLVEGVGAQEHRTPHLLLDGSPAVRLVVLVRHLPRGRDMGLPSERQARLIMRMIAEVPGRDCSGEPRRRLRIGNLVLAVLTGIGWLAAPAYLLAHLRR
ncbi:hypothetical protein [Catellatospora methionotrophica]|uniref:hypothetical protein n=1 Tax=Catellatospora methionotrophica TaxID=121620 RepID=UPI0033C842A8